MDGIEWVVEASGCSSQGLRDPVALENLFNRMIQEMNLRPVGPTQWHQFPGTGGITGLCLLAESHLACPHFPEHLSLCLNLFCCVPRARSSRHSAMRVSRIDINRMGHGMIRPATGSIFSVERRRIERIHDRVFFANSDLSGISIFEEAQYHGVEAAQKVLARLSGRP